VKTDKSTGGVPKTEKKDREKKGSERGGPRRSVLKRGGCGTP